MPKGILHQAEFHLYPKNYRSPSLSPNNYEPPCVRMLADLQSTCSSSVATVGHTATTA